MQYCHKNRCSSTRDQLNKLQGGYVKNIIMAFKQVSMQHSEHDVKNDVHTSSWHTGHGKINRTRSCKDRFNETTGSETRTECRP